VRGLWLVAAALQLLLPGAAAWADARLDAAGVGPRAHVESHTTDTCARLHPPDCALCHFLTAPLVPRRPTVLRLAAADSRAPTRTERAAPPETRARPHPQPRAPPALS